VTRSNVGSTLTALREGVGIAVDSLRANKTRAALTILGIAIGVMVVMAMAATVKGINSTVDRILAQTGPTTFYVFRFEGGGNADDDDSDPAWWRYPAITPAERDLLDGLATIDAVTMDDRNTRQVRAEGEVTDASVYGRSPAWPHVNGGDIVSGRSYSLVEEESGDKVAVLNEKAAEVLFGRRDPVGRRIQIAGQSYDADRNPRLHKLLKAFHGLTGCPVLVNTSFNVRGEPIVCTPQDAYRCFLATDMDALVLENCVLLKEKVKKKLGAEAREKYLAQFQLD